MTISLSIEDVLRTTRGALDFDGETWTLHIPGGVTFSGTTLDEITEMVALRAIRQWVGAIDHLGVRG